MDIYGYGPHFLAALHEIENHQRGTGRTTTLVKLVRDGDIVVFIHEQEARRFGQLCRREGKEVETRTIDVHSMHRIGEWRARQPEARIWFDHCLIEAVYRDALVDVQRMIMHYSLPTPIKPTPDLKKTIHDYKL